MAVIFAALLHAVWNALVKGGADKYLNMTAVVLGHLPLAIVLMFLVPAPAPESWPYVFAGAALHFGYQLFLLHAYRNGDLTQVYPIARGSAPLIVAAISVLLLGVHLQSIEIFAVLIIGAGIISMSLVRRETGLRNTKAALLALITGCFIASYSLVDGTGARLSGSAFGFYAWIAILEAVVFGIFMGVTRPATLMAAPTRAIKVFIVGGSASFGAYAIVIWAFTQAPIALVSAMRETSIVFALFIGVFFLKEKLDLAKVLSTMVTLFGAALLKLAKP